MASRPSSKTEKLPRFTELNNLCSSRNGASIIFATDDWFAAAENLLKESDAEWREGEYDDYGKWMDGWETRRKRIPGHDWSIIKLAYPCVIHGIDVDTSYFTGNFTPKISLQAACIKPYPPGFELKRIGTNGKAASEEEFKNIAVLKSQEWTTIVPKTPLGAGYADTCHNYLPVESREKWTHVRLNMYPDGGIARLRVYGQVERSLHDILDNAPRITINTDAEGLIDLGAMENGGICLGYSDAHYGHPRNTIVHDEPENMGQGWETARRLDRPEILTADENGILQVPGNEWSIFRLGVPGHIYRIQVDTTHYKGNFPDSFTVQAGFIYGCDQNIADAHEQWHIVAGPKKLGANKKHFFDVSDTTPTYTHVRLTMAPDGGIARFRLWGKPARNSFEHAKKKEKNFISHCCSTAV